MKITLEEFFFFFTDLDFGIFTYFFGIFDPGSEQVMVGLDEGSSQVLLFFDLLLLLFVEGGNIGRHVIMFLFNFSSLDFLVALFGYLFKLFYIILCDGFVQLADLGQNLFLLFQIRHLF